MDRSDYRTNTARGPEFRPTAAPQAHQHPAAEEPPKQRVFKRQQAKGFLKRKWKMLVVTLVVLAGFGILGYGYAHTRGQLTQLSKKNAPQLEGQELVKDIGKNIQLPDETPTLATVNDVSKLKNQEFFKNAQNGDKVLIFSNAGRALLYRPSTHKVIEYSRVDLSNSQTP